jgi:hypothetical protein
VRIDHIRESVLSAYPPVPDLSAPRLAVAGTQPFNLENVQPGPSKIPRAKPESTKTLSSANASTSKFTIPSPEPSRRQLITSTPPPTVKPRSANIRQPMVSHKHNIRQGSRVPRTSIRFSLATNRRPSLFAADGISDEEDEQEDEVHRVREPLELYFALLNVPHN